MFWLFKLQLSTCPNLYTICFGIWNVSSLGSCLKLVKGYLEQCQSIMLQLPFFLSNLDRFLAIDSFLSGLCLESWKDLFQVWIYNTFAVQHLLRCIGFFSLNFEYVTFMCIVWIVWLMSLVSRIVMRASQGCLSRSCSHVPCGVL